MSYVPPLTVVAEILVSAAADPAAVHTEVTRGLEAWHLELGAGFPASSRLSGRIAQGAPSEPASPQSPSRADKDPAGSAGPGSD